MAEHIRSPEATLLAIAQALNASLHLETALDHVLELTAEVVDADGASMFVRQEDEQEELNVSFVRRGGSLQQGAVSGALGISGHVMRTGEAVRVADVLHDPRYRGKLDTAFGTNTRALLAVPLRRQERLSGVLEAIRETSRPFTLEDLELLQAVADELAVAVENARLVDRLEWELKVRELLLESSRKVGSSLDLDEVVDHLLSAIAEVLPYDAGGVYLLDPGSGSLKMLEHRGYPPGTDEVLRKRPGQGLTGWVSRNRRSLRIGNVKQDPRYLEARPSTCSEIAVPIVRADEVVGVITLESDLPDAYTDRQLNLLEMIGAHVASAIANAQLYEQELERGRLRHELSLAREIQVALLPESGYDYEKVEATGVNVPSSEVGGDYYDYFDECPHHTALVIGDVSGHGMAAALLAAALRGGVHVAWGSCTSPAALATRLDRVVFRSTPTNQFVAAVLALLDHRNGKLRYCNAGHVPPLVIGESGTRSLVGGGMILGAFPGQAYRTRSLRLDPGDIVVFFTDGLSEMVSLEGVEFGEERLAAVVREHRDRPLSEIVSEVRKAVRRHRAGTRRRDDVTLMLARWRGPAD